MFSTTTIALSTSIPSARMSENSTTMFMDTPSSLSTPKDRNIEEGIEMATKSDVRSPRKKSSTLTIRMSPEMMLFSSELTMEKMSRDMSPVIFTVMVAGKSGLISSMTALTWFAVSMMFSPDRLTMSSVTTGDPSSRA